MLPQSLDRTLHLRQLQVKNTVLLPLDLPCFGILEDFKGFLDRFLLFL